MPPSTPSTAQAQNDLPVSCFRYREFPPIFGITPRELQSDPAGSRFLPWLRRIRCERQLILEWNNAICELQVWYWPVVNGQRVPPSELNALRQTHNFRGPCCLCAFSSLDRNTVTEAAIFLVTTGRLAGEYVAACAQSQCKYWSFLERLYSKRGLPIHVCTERVPGSSIPPAIDYTPMEEPAEDLFLAARSSQGSSSSSSNVSTPTRRLSGGPPYTQRPPRRVARRVRGTTNSENINPFIVTPENPILPTPPTTPFGFLMQLDRDNSSGVSFEKFRSLFTKCRRCQNVSTKAAFQSHQCELQVIDLTGDSD